LTAAMRVSTVKIFSRDRFYQYIYDINLISF
jgi:hypothetical protein